MKPIGTLFLYSIVLVLCSTGLGVQSCSTSNIIYTSSDIVTSTQRSEMKYSIRDKDRRSPLYYLTQSIVKETGPGNVTTYTAYDILSLSSSSFKLDDRVIFIVDNEVFPMKVKNIELEYVKSVSEETGNVMTSDSTTISVITGYSEENRKITRFSYNIPSNVIEKIRDCDQLSIRYYSGPSMITLTPKRKSISRLKELTATE